MQSTEHARARVVLVRAQAARFAETPTSDRAARRNEPLNRSDRQPAHDARLLHYDHVEALAAVRQSKEYLTAARAQLAEAAAPSAGRRDRVESARRQLAKTERQLATSSQRLASIESLVRTTSDRPEAIEAIRQEVALIDAALEPRIRAAVDNPAPYLTDALGERQAGESNWDHRATIVENYRQAALGKTPNDGPLGDHNPALGPEPGPSPLYAAWHDAVRASEATMATDLGQER